MTETKKILLIGRSGRGKSTLANVITEAENKFKESGGSASETRKIQFEEFADKENNINYLVIDTPGIGDTKMSDNEVLDIIAEAVYLVRNGLSHVFFVIDGRFDQYEMITYNLLRETIFDQDITKHTTITRTRFKDFKNKKKCQADIDLMVKEAEDKKSKLKQDISAKEKELANLSSDSNQYQELLEEIKQLQKDLKVVNLSEIIESCQKKVVYVDNPPISIAIADNEDEKRKREREEELQSNKKKRAKSREKVLEHLKNNCQNDSYKPEKLTNLSNEITEDMDNLLRSRKEYEEEMK
ncbi:14923_t:CDS:1, partial [Funneliformis geosporum]